MMQCRSTRVDQASHRSTVLKFLTVGGLTAVLYWLVFAVLWYLVHMGRMAAVSIAYATAILFHFIMNRRFTFHAAGGDIASHAIRYVIMVSINYGITLAVVELAVSYLLLSPFSGVVLGTGTTFLTGYLLSRFWVFQP